MVPVPPEASPERLTAMLRGAGVLEHGRVVDVAIESSRDTVLSRITRLRVTYDDAGDAGPSHVFWKSQRRSRRPCGRRTTGCRRGSGGTTSTHHARRGRSRLPGAPGV